MSAIEVLKNFVPLTWNDKSFSEDQLGYYQTCQDEDRTKEIDKALSKALLALEFFDWIKKQKKKCEKDLMLYGDYYNKLLLAETVYQWYKEQKKESGLK